MPQVLKIPHLKKRRRNYEKQGADWLTEQLVEASDYSNSTFSLSQGVDQRIQ